MFIDVGLSKWLGVEYQLASTNWGVGCIFYVNTDSLQQTFLIPGAIVPMPMNVAL